MDHWIANQEDHMLLVPEPESEDDYKPTMSNDRGEFGMPNIGVGRIFEVPPKVRAGSMTPEAKVASDLFPDIMRKFLENNAKYARAQTGHDLGIKGIIPDINRKTSALITRIWDDVEAGRDSTAELADDLIGHLLLLRAKMIIAEQADA